MSHRNTPNRRSHLDISPPSIKGPNLLLPPGLDLDSYSTIDTLPRQEASESDQRAAINRENELYTSLASNKPSYFKSTSIEADLLTSSTPRTVQKTKVIISRGHRSKTVTRLHGSEQNILSNSGFKPTPSANAVDNVSEVKQQHNPEIPEIKITFEEKKVEGKSFVGDFLAERRRPIPQFSPLIRVNGQESPVRIVAQEENEPKTIPCNEQIDTENIAKSLFEKYHKEIPITEKDVLLPTFGFTSSPRQPVEDEEEAKSIKKIPTRLLQNDSRTPLKVRFLPAVDVKISAPKELPEVKTTKALHRSPTNLLPPNLSNVETKHRRYNTQIKERKPQLDINPLNLSKESSQPEISGAHVLAKTLERVQHLGNRTAINKELAFRQKVRGNYEFDFPRERTVQRVMAPDPKAYVNNLMKKALAKRSDRFLFKMTQDKEEVVAEEIILDLDATKEKSIPKIQPLTEKKALKP